MRISVIIIAGSQLLHSLTSTSLRFTFLIMLLEGSVFLYLSGSVRIFKLARECVRMYEAD